MNGAPLLFRSPAALLYLITSAVLAVGLAGFNHARLGDTVLADRGDLVVAPGSQAYEARLAKGPALSLAKGTEGLLRQTALHLARMQSGASVSGFPGFEPPDDDEAYRRKIRDRDYTAQDVNDWVKEINNFLAQIAKKNPGLSLEEILRRYGSNEEQIKQFIESLQEAHYMANSRVGYGVNLEMVRTLQSMMETLGVPTWEF